MYNIIMRPKIYLVKAFSSVTTALGGLVYSFHKKIKGVNSKFNLRYAHDNKKQKLDVFYPENDGDKKYPIIVYFHGGGWACYDKKLYVTFMRRLSAMGYVVFSCNYSLAPKHKIGDILNDAKLALKFACENAKKFGGNSDIIALGGDSAGAHIATTLTLMTKEDENFNKIKALLLYYGAFDLTSAVKTGFNNIKDYIGSIVEGGLSNESELKYWSPYFKDLKGFPPTFLASGEIDKLHATQSRAFSEKLKESGVKVKTVFFPKKETRAAHAFMNFDGLETTNKVLNETEEFLADEVPER